MADQKVDFNPKEISPAIGAKSASGNGGITAGTNLVEVMPFLFVRIVQATNLPPLHPSYSGYPFVALKLGRYNSTTPCSSNGSNPQWNQVFGLDKAQIQTQETTLEITLQSNVVMAHAGHKHRTTRQATLGRISFAISDVPTRFPTDSALAPQWYGLQDPKGRKTPTPPELMLCAWIGTQADQAFSEAWHLDAASIGIYDIDNTLSQVYVMPRIWCLRVHVNQAQNLVLEDTTQDSQIFVRATLGSMTFTSKSVDKNNGNPKWNEDLLIVVAEPFNQELVLSVEQGTLESHKSLGTCVFPVKNVDRRLDGSTPSTKIMEVKQNEVIAGKLSLRLSLDGGYHIFDEDPQWSSDLNATAKKLWRPSIGVFKLGILNATSLPAMKAKNRTDAFCVAKYGAKWVRTRTVINSLSPKWNEQYSWDVYDPCTFITISVFDNSQLPEGDIAAGEIDARMGKVRISLSELETNKIYTYSYPLFQLQSTGLKKMGEIQLAFEFSCPDIINLYKMYTFPMLPRLHFANPLSPIQLNGLRRQAAIVVSSKMNKYKPPMRSEVVEYMLDSRESIWSMRRGKADFDRITILLSGLVALRTQFDEICKWKNPVSTLMICPVLLLVIFFPQVLLPAIFSCLILNVFQQYQKKPRQPSHVDLQLSCIGTASVDELEEEFDPIPTKLKNDSIIRNRYDRLRITAGKYVALMGEFATRGEKLQSLVSWQDPIASMLLLILCLITGIVTVIVPFRAVVCVWFIYLLRHPMFRSPLPPFHENLFSRMPSKLDSMI